MIQKLAPIRIGFVGCGEIVRTRHLPALQGVRGCNIVAFADTDARRLDLMAKVFPAAMMFASAGELVQSENVDLVAVCTPPGTHCEIAMEALRAGKHVFIEKPLALSTPQCEALIQAAEESAGQILAGFNLRWHALTQGARRYIESGVLGEILVVRSIFATRQRRTYLGGWRAMPDQGGDVINDLAIHHFDLLINLLRTDFECINVNLKEMAQHSEFAHIQAELANKVSVSGQFISGAPDQNEIELIGTQGRLVVDYYRHDGLEFYPIGVYPGSLSFRLRNAIHSFWQLPGAVSSMRRGGDYFLSYQAMWQDLLECISTGKMIDYNLGESCKATRMALAALESARTGQPVQVDKAPQHIPELKYPEEIRSFVDIGKPALAAIIVVPDKIQALGSTIRRLCAQTIANQMEIVLVLPDSQTLANGEIDLSPFCCTQLVEVGKITSIAHAYSAGIHRANAPLVVLTEDHSFPEPDWAEALVAAHRLPWAAVGPSMLNANPDSLVSWADFYIAYGEWAEHQFAYSAAHLPGHNSCYKREVLLAYGERLGSMLEAESVLHWDLRKQGHELLLESAAKTQHLNFAFLSVWIRVQYFTGRMFAAARANDWTRFKRLAYTLASPLIPLVRLRRIHQHIRRSHDRGFFWGLLPALLVGLVLDAFGQMVGYAFGSGNSLEKAAAYEFNRIRYVRRPESFV